MTALLWLAAMVAGLWVQRSWRAGRRERRFHHRHPAAASGIVIGAEPRTLVAEGSRALLLIHGYNDSPRSLEGIAARVHAAGWTVRLPLLPGHGRSLEAWGDWTAEQAIALVRDEFDALRRQHGTVVVGGLSMGGALATWVAAEAEPAGLLLYAPMLFVPRPMQLAVSTARLWNLATRYLTGGGGRSILDPVAKRAQISYGCSTRRSLEAVERIAAGTAMRLGFVKAPLLFVQSEEDNRLPEDQSRRALARLGSTDRTVHWTRGAGHVVTVDYGWEAVAATTVDWLTARFPAAG